MQTDQSRDDMAALARGGRTNFFGFLLRLFARLPFLFIAGQLYGAEALGRFAYATMVVELMAQLATLGLKRGLAAELARNERPATHVIGDGLVLAWLMALVGATLLIAVPEIMFRDGKISALDRLFPLTALFIVGSDVTLAALAYRHKIGAQVTARSIVEPWVLTLVAAPLALVPNWESDGMIIAYAVSMGAAFVASMWPAIRCYGLPSDGWRPHPARLFSMARANAPLAGADAIDWAARRIDILLLGLFADTRTLGIYWVAQQVASLPQKLKVTFDPILAPVVARGVARGEMAAVAGQVRQAGFWVTAMQLGVALALGLTGEAVMKLVGSEFTGGATILLLLLLTEVLYSTAAVSESALVFMARHRNLLWSLATLGVQVALTLVLAPAIGGVGAALALAISAAFASAAKARLLGQLLGHAVTDLRWALLLAATVALVVGLLCRFLPYGWLQIVVGIPVILGSYALILGRYGFHESDRLLFARRKGAKDAANTP